MKQECYALDLDIRFNNIEPLITDRVMVRQTDKFRVQMSSEVSWS
jgi:hypothetical protein